MKKRIIALLLCFAMCVSLVGCVGQAIVPQNLTGNEEIITDTTTTPVVSEEPVVTDEPEVTVTPSPEVTVTPSPEVTPVPSQQPVKAASTESGEDATQTPDYSAYEGKTVKFSGSTGINVAADPSTFTDWDGNIVFVAAGNVPTDLYMVVEDTYYQNGTNPSVWFKVKAANGYTLTDTLAANPWVFQNYASSMGSNDTLVETTLPTPTPEVTPAPDNCPHCEDSLDEEGEVLHADDCITLGLCAHCAETVADDGTVTHADGCIVIYNGAADVGKYVKPIKSVGTYHIGEATDGVVDDPVYIEYSEFETDTIMKITDWYWDSNTTALWYQVEFYSGGVVESAAAYWPEEPWILMHYTDPDDDYATSLEFVTIEESGYNEVADHAAIGAIGKFANATFTLYKEIGSDDNKTPDAFGVSYFAIEKVYVNSADETDLWYYINHAKWPADYADYHFVKASQVTVYAQEDVKTEEKNLSESAGGHSVTVSGSMPADVYLNVKAVAESELSGLGFTVKGEVLAALDITPTRANGTPWQPTAGEPVMVELDAGSMGLSDGDIVTLHHKHGDTVSVYDVYLVIDGKLTFWTDSFSIYLVSEEEETTGTQVTANSTYEMTIGETLYFYNNSGSRAGVWQVTDDSNAIDYVVYDTGYGNPVDYQYQARWIKVTAVDTIADDETVTLTYTYINNNGATRTESFYIKVTEPDFYIDDQIPETGYLVPTGYENAEGITYTWTRSDDEEIKTDALNTDETTGVVSVNVSVDRGGIFNTRSTVDGNVNVVNGNTAPVVYTCEVTDASGEVLATDTYEVLYGNEILNSSFEMPSFTNLTNKYFVNGAEGLFWKTTAPGSGSSQLTQDVELIREGSGANNSYGVRNAAEGYQFAEINAENFGGLYQDMLSTPGATLSWQFSHAARTNSGSQNNMYIIVGATKDMQDITTFNDIDDVLDTAKAAAGTTIPSSGSGFAFTYKGKTFYIWNHDAAGNKNTWDEISGNYTVPNSQYLTRLMFVSDTTGSDSTLGNLIDGVSAIESMNYVIKYYVDDELQSADTEGGEDTYAEVYSTVTLSNLQKYLSAYTFATQIKVNGKTYPGTINDLLDGLQIKGYGDKSGSAMGHTEDIVLEIYFTEPNIVVIKEIEIEGWSSMTTAQKEALVAANDLTAKFDLLEGTTKDQDTTIVINGLNDTGNLSAQNAFNVNSKNGNYKYYYDKTFTVFESAAPSIDGYVLSGTTYQTTFNNETTESNTVTLKEEAGMRAALVTVTNTYTRAAELTITKNVVGADDVKEQQEYTFTVNGPNDFSEPVTLNKDNNWSYTIKNLNPGTYTVTETTPTDMSGYKYISTSYQVNGGTPVDELEAEVIVVSGETTNVTYLNKYQAIGNLEISKTVVDAANASHEIDKSNQEFTFTVTFSGDGFDANKSYTYTGNDGTIGTLKSGGTLKLKHGENVRFEELPAGVTYTVTEAAVTGFTADEVTKTGTIPTGGTATAAFTNTYSAALGKLTITKQIEEQYDDDSHPGGTFNFTVSANDLTVQPGTYTIKVGDETKTVTVENGAVSFDVSITVAKGDMQNSLEITGLPEGTYTVEEKDDNPNFNFSGPETATVVANGTGTATVTNTYPRTDGDLTIIKQIQNNSADAVPETAFNFSVSTEDPTVDLTKVLTVGNGISAITANSFVVTISASADANDLGAEKSLKISGLPSATYSVTEIDIPGAFSPDFDTDPVTVTNLATVTILDDSQTVKCVNTFPVGDLTINKTVDAIPGATVPTGDDAPTFKFTVDGEAVVANKEYTVVVDGAEQKIKSSADGELVVTLKKTAVIHDLELKDYRVVENVSGNDYVLVSSGEETGTINADDTASASFTNTYVPRGALRVSKFIDKQYPDDPKPIDETKAFEFTVTLNQDLHPNVRDDHFAFVVKTYNEGADPDNASVFLSGEFNETDGFTNNDGVLTFTLKHNQFIEIAGLPACSYTIAEADYTSEYLGPNFVYKQENPDMVIDAGETEEVSCYNTMLRSYGNLAITKVVQSNNAINELDTFEFTVNLRGLPVILDTTTYNVEYSTTTASTGTLEGNVYTLNGVAYTLPATVTLVQGDELDNQTTGTIKLDLHNGLTATIQNLPASAYTVVEKDYSAQYYGTTWTGDEGVIGNNETAAAVCTNIAGMNRGNLRIDKTVKKPAGSTEISNETFTVKVDLDGEDANSATYIYKLYNEADKSLVSDGTFTPGDTLDLMENQYIVIENILAGRKATVTEVIPNGANYSVNYVTNEGTVIKSGDTIDIEVVNTFVGQLTINKTVTSGDDGTFLFHVVCEAPLDSTKIEMDVLVTTSGGTGSVVIKDLPLGKYTVTENTSWSWRYELDNDSAVKTAEIGINALSKSVAFNNKQTNEKWLNEVDTVDNMFTASANS